MEPLDEAEIGGERAEALVDAVRYLLRAQARTEGRIHQSPFAEVQLIFDQKMAGRAFATARRQFESAMAQSLQGGGHRVVTRSEDPASRVYVMYSTGNWFTDLTHRDLAAAQAESLVPLHLLILQVGPGDFFPLTRPTAGLRPIPTATMLRLAYSNGTFYYEKSERTARAIGALLGAIRRDVEDFLRLGGGARRLLERLQ